MFLRWLSLPFLYKEDYNAAVRKFTEKKNGQRESDEVVCLETYVENLQHIQHAALDAYGNYAAKHRDP